MRPKSEGFVRKAEAKIRASRPSGTYVTKPRYRTPAQKAEVKKATPKITPNAQIVKKRRADFKKARGQANRIALKKTTSDKQVLAADKKANAANYFLRRAKHDNKLNFQRKLGGEFSKPKPAKPATVLRSDGSKRQLESLVQRRTVKPKAYRDDWNKAPRYRARRNRFKSV